MLLHPVYKFLLGTTHLMDSSAAGQNSAAVSAKAAFALPSHIMLHKERLFAVPGP